jgi:hypothetical protein
VDSIRRWFAGTHGTITTKPVHQHTHRHHHHKCGHTHQRDDPRESVGSGLLQELCCYDMTTRFLQSHSTVYMLYTSQCFLLLLLLYFRPHFSQNVVLKAFLYMMHASVILTHFHFTVYCTDIIQYK